MLVTTQTHLTAGRVPKQPLPRDRAQRRLVAGSSGGRPAQAALLRDGA
jgi:hypothetical protein